MMFGEGLLTLVLAIIALIIANKSRKEIASLKARILQLESRAITLVPHPSTEAQSASVQTATPLPEPAAEREAPVVADPPLATSPASTASPIASAPTPGLEERLGTRWVVWLGGLILALGGFFMVRYSIDAGLLSPLIRCLVGALSAAALLAAGEFTRRRDIKRDAPSHPIANIPAILTAAGTSTAFASVYAAYALYDLLVPATAFVLLGIVAMCTLAAALLHGPALGGLGIAAAFVTPLLVSSDTPDYWALYLYLAVVTGASFALARIRMWRWLAATTLAFALLWCLPGLAIVFTGVAPLIFHIVAGFMLAALLVICGFMFGPAAEPDRVEAVSSIAPSIYLLGATLVVLTSGHSDTAVVTFALLIVATLALAWRAASATGAVGAAAALTAVVFANWALIPAVATLIMPGGAIPGIGSDPVREAATTHLGVAALFALAFTGAGYLAQGRFTRATVPTIWAAAGTFTPLALLITTYARIANFDQSIPFAILAIVVAGGFAWATDRLSRASERPGHSTGIALYATGAFASLALGLTFALERGWLTIALSLTALGAIYVYTKRPIPFLRWLAAILAAVVIARAAYAPTVIDGIELAPPIINWLLWGYGVPALSFWLASKWMRRGADDVPLRFVEAAAILFTVLLVFMQIRHLSTGGDITSSDSSLFELALQVCTSLAMAIGLERLRQRSKSIIHNVGALLLGVYAILATIFGSLLLYSPLIQNEDVGGLVFNSLLLGYAIPALLASVLARTCSENRNRFYVGTLWSLSLVLAMTYLMLQVRRFYQGPVLVGLGTEGAELYTYSIVWLAFGVILLGCGILFNSQRARLASAVVIGITILKAFLIDMDTLEGMYRALSFMGLGVVLVAIGWMYQRLLFNKSRSTPPAAEATPSPQGNAAGTSPTA